MKVGSRGPVSWVWFRRDQPGDRVKGLEKALGVEEKFYKEAPCLFTGEDGIGGVVVKGVPALAM
jgi:hypothetical protein